ncbi:MAG: glycosyltransferase family 4 protein [Hyphomicrobiaceae bacterium]|nr:glycosyltransferase family 4 protein [Hyphomicrobiaceae bacterium]
MQYRSRPIVLLVAGEPKTVIRFRYDFLKALVASGYAVYVTTPKMLPDDEAALSGIGVVVIETPIARASITPIHDLRYTHQMFAICRQIKPSLVLAYTMKAVVFGTLAARMARVPAVSSLIPGLGYAFSDIDTGRRHMINYIAKRMYQSAFARSDVVIFQNKDDIDTVVQARLITRDRCRLVDGSGVNIETFPCKPLPDNVMFLVAARLLKSKGVAEFIGAARILKAEVPTVDFVLAGPQDPSPDRVDPNLIDGAVREGVIRYLGNLNDIRQTMEEATVFVLPSYYREGVPRAGLEALSMGRPIIATDMPGCR